MFVVSIPNSFSSFCFVKKERHWFIYDRKCHESTSNEGMSLESLNVKVIRIFEKKEERRWNKVLEIHSAWTSPNTNHRRVLYYKNKVLLQNCIRIKYYYYYVYILILRHPPMVLLMTHDQIWIQRCSNIYVRPKICS